MVRNSRCQEADQWLFTEHSKGVKLWTTENKFSKCQRGGLALGTTGLQVECPTHSGTLPPKTSYSPFEWQFNDSCQFYSSRVITCTLKHRLRVPGTKQSWHRTGILHQAPTAGWHCGITCLDRELDSLRWRSRNQMELMTSSILWQDLR